MGSILTFYSYKGGVGRTMAVANIAALLAMKGLRVLIVDWDLEAPGLHRYFADLDIVSSNLGLLDLLLDAGKAGELPDWRKYGSQVRVKGSASLTMLTAGRLDDEYDKRLLSFEWSQFFGLQNGGALLESLRDRWVSDFDLTLIDSRTGVSDSGGICTVQMPDILVPVFSPNRQSLEGTKNIVLKAQAARQKLAYDRTRFLVLPLLARLDSRTEYREYQTWLRLFASELGEFYRDWLPKSATPIQILERTKIPYVAFFSFGEKLPVVTEGTSDPESLGFAYENAATLIATDFKRVDELLLPASMAITDEGFSGIPSPEMLASTGRLSRFAEGIIASQDIRRFKMLVEMARGKLLEAWDLHEINGPRLPEDIPRWIDEIADFYRLEFRPTLDSVVDLALLVIKYDAASEWVSIIIDLLVEIFETSRRFDRLKSLVISTSPKAMHYARPAYDVYVGARAIAAYAVSRKRFPFLKSVLPRYVRWFTMDNNATTFEPLLFWPFRGVSGLPDMREGRNESLWADNIQSAWGKYFGSREGFLNAAAQLEFVLEFNSYVFVSSGNKGVNKFQQELGDKSFVYLPDFWTSPLDRCVPIAEHFYDILLAEPTLPAEFTIEKKAVDLLFESESSEQRLLFLGGYLTHLKTFQSQAMLQANRFPFVFNWGGGRLGRIVKAFVELQKAQRK
jgi:MinD-like ATPase involved in chromosome partitioning or flagellar assembly